MQLCSYVEHLETEKQLLFPESLMKGFVAGLGRIGMLKNWEQLCPTRVCLTSKTLFTSVQQLVSSLPMISFTGIRLNSDHDKGCAAAMEILK